MAKVTVTDRVNILYDGAKSTAKIVDVLGDAVIEIDAPGTTVDLLDPEEEGITVKEKKARTKAAERAAKSEGTVEVPHVSKAAGEEPFWYVLDEKETVSQEGKILTTGTGASNFRIPAL